MPDKWTDWPTILVSLLFGMVLAGIRWYLLDLKGQMRDLHKKFDKLDIKFSSSIRDVHTRIDKHIEKGD